LKSAAPFRGTAERPDAQAPGSGGTAPGSCSCSLPARIARNGQFEPRPSGLGSRLPILRDRTRPALSGARHSRGFVLVAPRGTFGFHSGAGSPAPKIAGGRTGVDPQRRRRVDPRVSPVRTFESR